MTKGWKIAGFLTVAVAVAGGASAGQGGSRSADGRRLNAERYLKLQGDGTWVEVLKAPGRLRIDGSVPEPRREAARPAAAATNSGLFEPYVAYGTGSWPEAVAIGDVNGDGRNDVALTTSYYFDEANDYKLFVFLQQPGGTLAAPVKYPTQGTYSSRTQTVAIGDVTGDGRNDVVIGNSRSAIGVFAQNAAGGLDPVVSYPTSDSTCVRIADVNDDGSLDVVGLGWGTNSVSVLLQQPGGGLAAPVTYSAPHSGYDDLEVGDVDGDGRADVVVMSGQLYATPNVSVLYQQPDGSMGGLASRFIGSNILSSGVGVGDVNGDARSDVVASYGGNRPSSGIARFLQGSDGTLGSASTQASYDIPEPLEVADVNADGRPDAIVAHGGWMALGVYLQGEGQLAPEELYPLPYASRYNPHGLAVGDVSGDTFPDVVVADYNYGLVVLRANNPLIPKVTLVSPRNVQVLEGVPVQVQWTASGSIGSFDLAFSVDGGGSFDAIPGCTGLSEAARSCEWSSPGPASANARIRVTLNDRDGNPAVSDAAPISIVAPSLTVTSPNTGVTWAPGTSRTISWTGNLPSSAGIRIELTRDDGVSWTALAPSTANTGSYTWPVTAPSTASARVRVSWTDDDSVTDTSDETFTINRPPVADAGTGRTVELGSAVTLDGTASADPDGDPLTYNWTESDVALGETASVTLTPTLGTHAYSLSVRDPFGGSGGDSVTVVVEDTTPPAVLVTSPAPGSQLLLGVPVELAWGAWDNGALSSFDVSVSTDGGVTYLAVPGCGGLPGGSRSCPWTPGPAEGPAYIRVLGRDASGNGGAGGASYSIVAPAHQLTLTSPNTYVTWKIGSVHTISWTHDMGLGARVQLEVSRNGGSTWAVIASSVESSGATSGSYDWTVAGPATTRALIRVTWLNDPGVSDVSDSTFRIARVRRFLGPRS